MSCLGLSMSENLLERYMPCGMPCRESHTYDRYASLTALSCRLAMEYMTKGWNRPGPR